MPGYYHHHQAEAQAHPEGQEEPTNEVVDDDHQISHLQKGKKSMTYGQVPIFFFGEVVNSGEASTLD